MWILLAFVKYLVDRFEYKQIATLQTTGPKGYNNLWGQPLDLKAAITYEANLCQTASTGHDFSKILQNVLIKEQYEWRWLHDC